MGLKILTSLNVNEGNHLILMKQEGFTSKRYLEKHKTTGN